MLVVLVGLTLSHDDGGGKAVPCVVVADLARLLGIAINRSVLVSEPV